MQFFEFNATWFDFLVSAFFVLPYFIAAKILTLSGKPNWKEVLYIVAACLFSATFILLEFSLDGTMLRFIWSVFPALCALFFFFHKLHAKSYALSACLMILSFCTTLLLEVLSAGFQLYVLGLSLAPFNVASFIAYTLLFFLSTIIVINQLKKVSNALVSNYRLQKLSAILSVLFTLFFIVLINIQYLFTNQDFLFLSWTTILMLSYAIALFASLLLYAKTLNARQAVQEKSFEQALLLHYLQESEQQQTAMRKFKHDYQNLLVSFEDFMEAEDMQGLRQYYFEKVKTASEVITKSSFALEPLGKIKVREIKGLLTAKLTMAQNIGIDTMFEADHNIDHIPTDTIALVRMLGIILDNAIEELDTLGQGKLSVGCFRTKSSILFVVENTCRADMPNLSSLDRPGFSTKGEGRGTGLSNLSELAAMCPNITLQTNIKENIFLQKLTIGRP